MGLFQYAGMDALARWFLQTPLLPKLPVFKYVVEANMPPSWTPVFFSSSTLRELCLYGHDTESMHQAINLITPIITMLDNLTIQLPSGSRLHSLLAENGFLWKHSRLQSLQLSCVVVITPTMIYILSQLPALCYLSLHKPQLMLPTVDNNSPLASSDDAFPRLRSLQLESTFTEATLFLGATPPLRGLESLNLTLNVRKPGPDAVDRMSQASLHSLYSRFPRSLSSLRLHFLAITGPLYMGLLPNFSEVTTPLFSFPRLRTLSLHQTYASLIPPLDSHLNSLTDTALRSIAPAWPELEVFEYEVKDFARRGPDGDYPTFDSIIAFAQAHPRLGRLSLPFMNLLRLPHASLRPTTSPQKQGHPLQQLEIGAHIGTSYALDNATLLSETARAFLDAFPNLETTTFPPWAPAPKAFSEVLADAMASLKAS